MATTWLIFLSIGLCLIQPSSQCINKLKGIGTADSDIYTESQLLSTLPVGFVGLGYVSSVRNPDEIEDYITATEVPIQARKILYDAIVTYSILSAFDEIALEFFGRKDISEQRRRCSNLETENANLWKLHKSVTIAYAYIYSIRIRWPLSYNNFKNYFNNIGLDDALCEWNIDYINGTLSSNCSDISTPWGLAYIISKEMYEYGRFDGWNADGSYNGNKKYNRVEYSDYRESGVRYVPKNSPWKLEYLNKWQPLLETDNLGYIVYQEHVTPHIGYTGKSFFYTNEEFCDEFVIYEPDYDYINEMYLAIDRLADLTEKTKMEIEFFDRKNNLNTITRSIIFSLYDEFDSIEPQKVALIEFATIYESVLAAWKAKIDSDRVRPPSIIHELLAGQQITSYAGRTTDGKSLGVDTFDASDWEPYIRTMPHSEYPSASSCICQAVMNALRDYFGTDSIVEASNYSLPNGFIQQFAAFSSEYEPLSTPSESIEVNYLTFSEISQRCGQTRLEGGLHFTGSVAAGQLLCDDIGNRVLNTLTKIYNGQTPEYIVDVTDLNIRERDCMPNSDDGSGVIVNKNVNASLLQPCDHNPCQCDKNLNNFEDPFCKLCDLTPGCSECIGTDGEYFKLNYNYPCVSCQDVFFNSKCKFCQDFNGCGQCRNEYERRYDNFLRLWYCE